MHIRKRLCDARRWVGSRFTSNSAILLYHRVAENENDPFGLCVSPAHFEEQIEALCRAGTPLSLPDFRERHREGDLQPGSICVTFDDGYLDNLTVALPILEKFEVPATIFAMTGNLGKPFWWDRLIHRLSLAERAGTCVDFPTSDGVVTTVDIRGLTSGKALKKLYPHFRQLDPEERDDRLAEFAHPSGANGDLSDRRALREAELKELSDHPLIEIGAHTVSHTQLTSLSYEDQQTEISRSIGELAAILEKPVETFSYPFGLKARDYDGDTIRAAEAAGLDHAVAADLDVVSRKTDRFALPRLWAHDWSGARFGRYLKGWL